MIFPTPRTLSLACLIAIGSTVVSTPSWGWQKTLFMYCQTKSAMRVSDAGIIEADARNRDIEFTVDVQSGAVRLKYANAPTQWIVLRAGDAENDTVLVGQINEPARVVDLVLRIRDWASQPVISFTRISGVSMSSGTCKQL